MLPITFRQVNWKHLINAVFCLLCHFKVINVVVQRNITQNWNEEFYKIVVCGHAKLKLFIVAVNAWKTAQIFKYGFVVRWICFYSKSINFLINIVVFVVACRCKTKALSGEMLQNKIVEFLFRDLLSNSHS